MKKTLNKCETLYFFKKGKKTGNPEKDCKRKRENYKSVTFSMTENEKMYASCADCQSFHTAMLGQVLRRKRDRIKESLSFGLQFTFLI